MNPVRGSLRHPQVTLAITATLVAAGVYSLARMPRREDPKITIRIGLVSAVYPGATSEQVERQVTEKIEQRLFRYAEVRKDRTFSTSRPNIAIINVELEGWVKDTDAFWSKLRHDMNQLRATDLPSTVRGPVVDSDFGDTVAVLVAIRGHRYSYRELTDYTQRIEDALRSLRAVAKIRRVGEQAEEIQITSSLGRLSQYALNPVKVIAALQSRNAIEYGGKLETSQGEVPFNANGPFQTEEQIRRVIVDVSPLTGQPVHIGDVASVRRGYKDMEYATRFRGEPALMLAVEMQEGQNIVEFGKALRARLAEVKASLPPDLALDFVADQPRVVERRVAVFLREFGIAIGAVILVTVVLLPFRVALISALAIPVTVAVTFGAMNALGIELQQVSIAALIVVLGMVVDDAIVIADNYVELLDRRTPVPEAAWRSAAELAVPVLAATLTIVASFLPLLMLSGAVGEFIASLPVAVATALLTSFAVAMLLTPLLSQFFIKKGLHDEAESAGGGRFRPLAVMQQGYAATIGFALRRKGLALAVAALALGGGAAALRLVPRQFFPSAERDQFVIDIFAPEGTRIGKTDELARKVEARLGREPLGQAYSTFLGASAPRFYYNVNPQQPATNYAQILVNTRQVKGTPELTHALRDELARLVPEAQVLVRELQQGNVMEAPVEVRIAGDELTSLRAAGDQVRRILEATPGAVYVHTDYREDLWQVRIDVKEEVANRLGFGNATIARQLAGAFRGVPVTTLWEGNRAVDITLRVEEDRRQAFEDLENAYLISPLTGARLPLRALAAFRPEWQSGRIVRRNGVRTLTVRAFADQHHLASEVLAAAKPAIARLDLPPGCRISYGGEAERQADTFAELLGVLAVSAGAIFLILLFQFRSITDSLVVMAAIPLAFPGAVAGLLLTRSPFGFTAFMGMVSLGGVVVRNAIILVDYIRARLQEGVGLEQAAREAGERRLRPIFLTTMAAAVGVTPMILSGSSLWSPLASAIAAGLIVSMFGTLVIIPILFVLAHRRALGLPSGGGAAAGVLAAAALVALFAPAAASAAPRRITLDEAVRLAVQNNSAVRLASLKVREAEAKAGQARANYFPQLASESSLYNILERQRLVLPAGSLGAVPQFGAIPQAATTVFQGGRSLLLSQTTLAQPLTQLWKIREANTAARAEAGLAGALAERARVEVAARVKELYYTLLGLEARRRAAKAAVAAAEERYKETRDAVETGTALEVKQMQARTSLVEARQAALTLEVQTEDAVAEFNELLGLAQDTEPMLEAAGEVPALPPLEDLLRKAAAHNPELAAAELNRERARRGVAAAKADRIPEIGLFAQHIYQNGVPFLAANNGVAGLRLNYSVFDWGKKGAVVREREALLAQAEEERHRVSRRVAIDVEKAYRKVKRVSGLAALAREALAVRREALRIATDQVELGLCGQAAFEEARAAAATAEADLAVAEYQVHAALADLDRLAGSR